MNQFLLVPYSDEEIKDALFQIDPHTASGLEGIPSIFFQNFWSIVGSDVTCVVRSFLSTRCILRQLNYTMVSLIPKTTNP